jgi:predicted O-linked N-acetylglucosamine transferase (SPINDLY family)
MSYEIEHLQSYSMVDISVDTFPYAGTTTTCEALYMGVPVVTLRPKVESNHAHTVGASLLTRIDGMTPLIASTEEEYISVSVSLAKDLKRLHELRANLRPNMLRSSLCDGKGFVRNLEDTFSSVWRRFLTKGKGEIGTSTSPIPTTAATVAGGGAAATSTSASSPSSSSGVPVPLARTEAVPS